MKLVQTPIVLFVLIWSSIAVAQQQSDSFETEMKTLVNAFGDGHFLAPSIDAKFCKRWLGNYLDTLDPSKRYFLSTDIAEFESYLDKLPELAANGNQDFYQLVRKRYQTRAISSLNQAVQRLDQTFDYAIDESIPVNYARWPETEEDRTERWRLQLKYDLLIERTRWPENSDRIEFIKHRYESILKQVEGMSEPKARGMYFDSFCRTVDPRSGYLTSSEFSSYFRGLLKEYSLGLKLRMTNGRTIIVDVTPSFDGEPAAEKISGCELLGIRSANGTVYHVREIHLHTISRLIRTGMGKDEKVTLELYNEFTMDRFTVDWPRKWR